MMKGFDSFEADSLDIRVGMKRFPSSVGRISQGDLSGGDKPKSLMARKQSWC